MPTVGSLADIKRLMKAIPKNEDVTFQVAEELDTIQLGKLAREIDASSNLIVLVCDPTALPRRTIQVGHK